MFRTFLASFERLSLNSNRNVNFILGNCRHLCVNSMKAPLDLSQKLIESNSSSANLNIIRRCYSVLSSHHKLLPIVRQDTLYQVRNYEPPETWRNEKVTPETRINFWKIHERGIVYKRKSKKNPLGDKPFAKGVVLKTFVKKPRKPNSANRKCVLLRLSTGKEMTAYVPGIGHNLQEHNIVLVKVAKLRDVPGVKLKCVRGAYDLGHVVKKK